MLIVSIYNCFTSHLNYAYFFKLRIALQPLYAFRAERQYTDDRYVSFYFIRCRHSWAFKVAFFNIWGNSLAQTWIQLGMERVKIWPTIHRDVTTLSLNTCVLTHEQWRWSMLKGFVQRWIKRLMLLHMGTVMNPST